MSPFLGLFARQQSFPASRCIFSRFSNWWSILSSNLKITWAYVRYNSNCYYFICMVFPKSPLLCIYYLYRIFKLCWLVALELNWNFYKTTLGVSWKKLFLLRCCLVAAIYLTISEHNDIQFLQPSNINVTVLELLEVNASF